MDMKLIAAVACIVFASAFVDVDAEETTVTKCYNVKTGTTTNEEESCTAPNNDGCQKTCKDGACVPSGCSAEADCKTVAAGLTGEYTAECCDSNLCNGTESVQPSALVMAAGVLMLIKQILLN